MRSLKTAIRYTISVEKEELHFDGEDIIVLPCAGAKRKLILVPRLRINDYAEILGDEARNITREIEKRE